MSHAVRTSSASITSKIAFGSVTPSADSAESWSSYAAPSASAFSKIVGLVVSPVTASSRVRRASSPFVRIVRSMKSSQIDWPASWSNCSLFGMYLNLNGPRALLDWRGLLPALPLHDSPGSHAAQGAPERHQSKQDGHLPVSDIFHDGVQNEPQEIARSRIAAVRELFEHERPDRQEEPVANRHEQEQSGE